MQKSYLLHFQEFSMYKYRNVLSLRISQLSIYVSNLYMCIKNAMIFICYFLWSAQASFMRVFLSGTYLSSESTAAMQIKCFAQGHNTLIQPWLNP